MSNPSILAAVRAASAASAVDPSPAPSTALHRSGPPATVGLQFSAHPGDAFQRSPDPMAASVAGWRLGGADLTSTSAVHADAVDPGQAGIQVHHVVVSFGEGYGPGSVEVLKALKPARRRPDAHVTCEGEGMSFHGHAGTGDVPLPPSGSGLVDVSEGSRPGEGMMRMPGGMHD